MYLELSELKSSKEVADPIQNMTMFRTDFIGKCNIDCNYCLGMHTMNDKNYIPFDKACEVLDVALGSMSLKFAFLDCEGEFTLYDHAVDILDYIEDSFEDVTLFIYTNTTVIPKYFIERLNTMKKNYVYLATSISTWDRDSYEAFSKSSMWDTVIKNIKTYITQLNNKNVVYQFASIYWNEEQYKNTYNLLRKITEECGKTSVLYDRSTDINLSTENTANVIIPIVRAKGIKTNVVNENFNDTTNGPIYTDFFQKKKVQTVVCNWKEKKNWKESFNCEQMIDSFIVKSNGDVVPCIGILGFPEETLGNIFEQKVTYDWVKSIYHSDKMKNIQWRNVHDKAFDQCSKCMQGWVYD